MPAKSLPDSSQRQPPFVPEEVARRIAFAKKAIDTALEDTNILRVLSTYGYDEARLQGGQSLYRAARDRLFEQQQLDAGSSTLLMRDSPIQITPELRAAWHKANTAYGHALRVARVAFRPTPAVYPVLQLGGPRQLSLTGWLEQATTFYANLLADPTLVARMAHYGYHRARLEAEAGLVQAVADLIFDQQQAAATPIESEDDARLDELAFWMDDFEAIAHLALEEQPEWLEKLGFA